MENHHDDMVPRESNTVTRTVRQVRPITRMLGRMHLGWKIAFGVWALIWLPSELFASLADTWLEQHFDSCAADGWVRTGFMFLLLVMELFGLKWGIGKNGDTLSELFRGLLAELGAWASISLGGGIGASLALRIASLPFLLAGEDYALFTLGPWCFLAAGVMVWLIPHFRSQ